MSDFQKCPKCGCKTFRETALEWGDQSGVRIGEDGDPDYDDAGSIEYSGPTEKAYYTCEGCGTDLYIVGIELTTEEPGKDAPFSQFDSFEYHHCAEFSDSKGCKFVEQMTPEEVEIYRKEVEGHDGVDIIIDTFWSVYGHFREDLRGTNGCLKCLADFPDEETAKDMTEALNISKGGKL